MRPDAGVATAVVVVCLCCALELVHCLSLSAAIFMQATNLERSVWLGLATPVLQLWHGFMEACFSCASRPPALCALYPAPSLQQLAAQALQSTGQATSMLQEKELARGLISVWQVMYTRGLRPSGHPGLRHWLPSSSSFTPAQLEVCGANIAAALEQQVRGLQGVEGCLAG